MYDVTSYTQRHMSTSYGNQTVGANKKKIHLLLSGLRTVFIQHTNVYK
jgi:hypothetical protein